MKGKPHLSVIVLPVYRTRCHAYRTRQVQSASSVFDDKNVKRYCRLFQERHLLLITSLASWHLSLVDPVDMCYMAILFICQYVLSLLTLSKLVLVMEVSLFIYLFYLLVYRVRYFSKLISTERCLLVGSRYDCTLIVVSRTGRSKMPKLSFSFAFDYAD